MPVESKPLPMGTPAPDFALPDTRTGKIVRLGDFRAAPALLVMWSCNHCPYVKHIVPALTEFAKAQLPRGLAMVAISANDPERYPDDAPEALGREATRLGWEFPVLFDGTQEVARAYQAACTPEFYLFDSARKLVYQGRFDRTRPNGMGTPSGDELTAAVDAVLAGKPPAHPGHPAVGCGIKWKNP